MELNEILEVFDRLDVLNETVDEDDKDDEEEEIGDEDEDEEEEDEVCQIFPTHDALSDRLRKTMYYGGSLPCTDSLSLSLTEFSVQEFAKGEFRRLDQLNLNRAAWISQEACASPTSLLMALLYLERLRSSNPGYLAQTSSTDVFLVSLMVASKFLNDDGEEGEVFNEVWASSAGMDKSHINELEINFLAAIDWKIFVSEKEFGVMLDKLEQVIAKKHVEGRGWATYTDLLVLSNQLEFLQLLKLVYQYAFKVTAVCISAYTASLITMLGACCFLNSTPLGPQAVQNSVTTILSLGSFTSLVESPQPTEYNSSSMIYHADSIDEESIVRIMSNVPVSRLDDFLHLNWTFPRTEKEAASLPNCQNHYDKSLVHRRNLITARIDHCVGVR